jgi:hypothetical protein
MTNKSIFIPGQLYQLDMGKDQGPWSSWRVFRKGFPKKKPKFFFREDYQQITNKDFLLFLKHCKVSGNYIFYCFLASNGNVVAAKEEDHYMFKHIKT